MELPSPTIQPDFDKKYTVIIKYQLDNEYMNIMDWLNTNCVGSVDIKILESRGYEMYVAFENPDDALIFKIKYM